VRARVGGDPASLARGAGDILVFGGGIIPDEDLAALKTAGVAAVFKPGTTTNDIVKWVEANVRPR
jgi:methylmalonyl-CoA mutase C-terminal domain/subunit